MLLHDSRRDARLDDAGDLVILEEQDRSRWDRDQIAEALPLAAEGLREGLGPFSIQATIAALHCQAARAGGHGLAPDPRALRSAGGNPAVADRVAQPRGCGRDD